MIKLTPIAPRPEDIDWARPMPAQMLRQIQIHLASVARMGLTMRFAPALGMAVACGRSAWANLGALLPPVPPVTIRRRVGYWCVMAAALTLAAFVVPGVCVPAGPVALRDSALRVAPELVTSLACFSGMLAACLCNWCLVGRGHVCSQCLRVWHGLH